MAINVGRLKSMIYPNINGNFMNIIGVKDILFTEIIHLKKSFLFTLKLKFINFAIDHCIF